MSDNEKKTAKQKTGQHLKQYHFKPGQSGNPTGALPGKRIDKKVREAAVEKVEEWFNLVFINSAEDTNNYAKENWDKLSLADQVMLTGVGMEHIDGILNRVIGKPAQAKTNDNGESESVESFMRRLLNVNNEEG